MLNVIVDENCLKEAGYIHAAKFGEVKVSANLVAKMHRVATATVINYANAGQLPVTEDDKFLLSDALTFDFKKLHDDYCKSRKPIITRYKYKHKKL